MKDYGEPGEPGARDWARDWAGMSLPLKGPLVRRVHCYAENQFLIYSYTKGGRRRDVRSKLSRLRNYLGRNV